MSRKKDGTGYPTGKTEHVADTVRALSGSGDAIGPGKTYGGDPSSKIRNSPVRMRKFMLGGRIPGSSGLVPKRGDE